MKQKLSEVKGEVDSLPINFGDFNTSLLTLEQLGRILTGNRFKHQKPTNPIEHSAQQEQNINSSPVHVEHSPEETMCLMIKKKKTAKDSKGLKLFNSLQPQ